MDPVSMRSLDVGQVLDFVDRDVREITENA